MPILMEILKDGHVVHYKGQDPWTVDELLQVFPQDRQHRDSAPFRVHVVADMTEMRSIPTGIFALRHEKMANHPNTGQTVIIVANRFARKIVQIVLQVANNERVAFFDDAEQAWQYVTRLIADETVAG